LLVRLNDTTSDPSKLPSFAWPNRDERNVDAVEAT